MMCMDFGGHRVYPNPLYIICPYLGTCITPCRFYGGEIGTSERNSVQSTVSKLLVVSVEAPLQTRVFHRPHTSLCGNLGGTFCCGQPYIPFSANTSGEIPFYLVDEIELIFNCSSNDDVKASILKLGLGVGVVVVLQSSMHSGCEVGVLVFGQGGRGTLTLRTSQLGFFLVLISPFQFFIVISCWA